MTTERDLIQRLADALDAFTGGPGGPYAADADLVAEARAYLAIPEPAAGPTDEELWALYQSEGRDFSPTSFARAVLARYGSQPPQPIPLSDRLPGPTDDELMALAVQVFEDPFCTDKDYARAVLARYGHQPPQPIPLSERLPGLEDCDVEGRCWYLRVGDDQVGDWTKQSFRLTSMQRGLYRLTHWLPHDALPLPEVEHTA